MRHVRGSTVRWHSLAFAVPTLALAAPATAAPEDRGARIASTATICDSLSSDPARVAAALKAGGWKRITPNLGGMSIASLTGSEQYRSGRDGALISQPGSMVGPNCQFDFANVDDQIYTRVIRRLTALFGAPNEAKNDMVTWNRGNLSYSVLRRSRGQTTILWFMETKASK